MKYLFYIIYLNKLLKYLFSIIILLLLKGKNLTHEVVPIPKARRQNPSNLPLTDGKASFITHCLELPAHSIVLASFNQSYE